jgi:hypothetical protein
MAVSMGYMRNLQRASLEDRHGLMNEQVTSQADALREERRMREINRKAAELGVKKQEAELADRRNPDGSLKSDAEYAFELEKRKGEFNDSIAERGWRKRQEAARAQRLEIENENKADASGLFNARAGRRRRATELAQARAGAA